MNTDVSESQHNPDGYLLGLDLGGTRLKALAITPQGVELARETAATDGPDWQEHVLECVQALTKRFGPPLAMGVAAPGLAAPDERSIVNMPGRLPGLVGLDWTNFLQSTVPVRVLNDAHAALLGEISRGAAQGVQDVIMLTLGTGVGGAIWADGRLLRGHLGRAGHLGHITLDAAGAPDIVLTPGSLEDAVGNHSLSARSDGRYASSSVLVAEVDRGEPVAVEIWTRMMRDLAAGLASLINVLDPALILLGGGLAEAGDTLLAPLRTAMEALEWRPQGHSVPIVRAQLGDWAGAYGAAALAQQSYHASLS